MNRSRRSTRQTTTGGKKTAGCSNRFVGQRYLKAQAETPPSTGKTRTLRELPAPTCAQGLSALLVTASRGLSPPLFVPNLTYTDTYNKRGMVIEWVVIGGGAVWSLSFSFLFSTKISGQNKPACLSALLPLLLQSVLLPGWAEVDFARGSLRFSGPSQTPWSRPPSHRRSTTGSAAWPWPSPGRPRTP